MQHIMDNFRDFKVVDNFLSIVELNTLNDYLSNNSEVLWGYSDNVVANKEYLPYDFKNPGICHPVFSETKGVVNRNTFELLNKIGYYNKVEKLLPDNLIHTLVRTRVFRTFKAEGLNIIPHTDFGTPNISILLYLEDSDGDTILYNKKNDAKTIKGLKDALITDNISEVVRVKPVQNRLLIFHGDQYHKAEPPRINTSRGIINSNYISTNGGLI